MAQLQQATPTSSPQSLVAQARAWAQANQTPGQVQQENTQEVQQENTQEVQREDLLEGQIIVKPAQVKTNQIVLPSESEDEIAKLEQEYYEQLEQAYYERLERERLEQLEY